MVDLLDDDSLLDLGKGKRITDPEEAVRSMRRDDHTPASNQALQEWAKPAPQHDGTCHLCKSPARLRCRQCNKGACGKDSWVMLGLCRTCATEERMRLAHDHQRTVGDDWLKD